VSVTDYERGLKEGRVEARLDGHDARLDKINGSIDRFSKSHDNLSKAVSVGLEKLANEIRKMQEEARARDLAVDIAAKTLAAETERRRSEAEEQRVVRAAALEAPVRVWSLRASKGTVIAAGISFALAVVGVLTYLSTHH
jgi:hypothetical protein